MQGYYDTEFQPELKRADVERELAKAARLDGAVTIRSRLWWEHIAALGALTAGLTRPARDARTADRPAAGTARS